MSLYVCNPFLIGWEPSLRLYCLLHPPGSYAIYSDQVVQSLSELFRTALGNKSGGQDLKSGIAKSSLPSSERIVR